MKTSGLFVWLAGKVIGLIEKAVVTGKPVVVIVFVETMRKSLGLRILNLSDFWLNREPVKVDIGSENMIIATAIQKLGAKGVNFERNVFSPPKRSSLYKGGFRGRRDTDTQG